MTIDQARRLQTMTRWHRRLAVFIMAWLVLLAGTGILVNHASDWGLDRKPLPGVIQYGVYGIEAANTDYCRAFPAAGSECGNLFADLELPEGRLLLGEHSMFLFDASGQLVEKVSAAQAGLEALEAGAVRGAAVYLRGGSDTVLTDPNLFDFRVVDSSAVPPTDSGDWQEKGDVPATISWERLLLDLHAARFLGSYAKAFNDLAAGSILLLALSGGLLYRARRKVNGV